MMQAYAVCRTCHASKLQQATCRTLIALSEGSSATCCMWTSRAHVHHLMLLWLQPPGLDGSAGLQESVLAVCGSVVDNSPELLGVYNCDKLYEHVCGYGQEVSIMRRMCSCWHCCRRGLAQDRACWCGSGPTRPQLLQLEPLHPQALPTPAHLFQALLQGIICRLEFLDRLLGAA